MRTNARVTRTMRRSSISSTCSSTGSSRCSTARGPTADPATNLDRPEQRPFRDVSRRAGRLRPGGGAATAMPCRTTRSCTAAARFAPQARAADGLEAILADYFGCRCEIRQFARLAGSDPARAALPSRDATASSSALGVGATLGGATWQCQHKFEIVLGPLYARDACAISCPARAACASCIRWCDCTRTTNGPGRCACCCGMRGSRHARRAMRASSAGPPGWASAAIRCRRRRDPGRRGRSRGSS